MIWIRTAFLLISLGCLAGLSQAQGDGRFQIKLHFEEQATPDLHLQVEQALPMLWDKIIPQYERLNIPPNIAAMSLLKRVQPQGQNTNIEFNADRIWNLLEQRNIAHIKDYPSFQLHVSISNAFGNSMPQSENELLNYAQQQAETLGIQLIANAPSLNIHMQWLNDSEIQLSVRGQSRLDEFSETRQLIMGEPFPQLQQWLIATLSKARDAYVWQAISNAPIDNTSPYTNDSSLIISIEQSAALSEQIAFETALKNDVRVNTLTPIYLNHLSRKYKLSLKDTDDSWLIDWFAKRGMSATATAQGWLIQ